jgi:hypothetical protein
MSAALARRLLFARVAGEEEEEAEAELTTQR